MREVKARGVALKHTNTACGEDNPRKNVHNEPATIRQSVHYETPDESNGRSHNVEIETIIQDQN